MLGVAHSSRLPFLPSAPTFRDEGFDLATAIWLGLFSPRGVAAPQLSELREAARATMRDSQTIGAIDKLLLVPVIPGSRRV